LKHIHIEPNRIVLQTDGFIAAGGYSSVRIAKLDGDRIVAVKELRQAGDNIELARLAQATIWPWFCRCFN
jgi:hypothetical protein